MSVCTFSLAAVIASGVGNGSAQATGLAAPKEVRMTLASSAFQPGGSIPARFTADGPDMSPVLAWSNAPAGTQAFALICDDPDAPVGTWVHWVVYDLPAAAAVLPEGAGKAGPILVAGKQGRNDFGRENFGGPAPPAGKPHRYFFRLYALDQPTGLPAGKRKADVLLAIKGHILAQAELMGTYRR